MILGGAGCSASLGRPGSLSEPAARPDGLLALEVCATHPLELSKIGRCTLSWLRRIALALDLRGCLLEVFPAMAEGSGSLTGFIQISPEARASSTDVVFAQSFLAPASTEVRYTPRPSGVSARRRVFNSRRAASYWYLDTGLIQGATGGAISAVIGAFTRDQRDRFIPRARPFHPSGATVSSLEALLGATVSSLKLGAKRGFSTGRPGMRLQIGSAWLPASAF